MGVPADIQAEAISVVHQFIQTIDKSLAQQFLKKTKLVSLELEPRVGLLLPHVVLTLRT